MEIFFLFGIELYVGTYMQLDKSKIIYGVDTDLDEKLNSKFISLLERPFKKWYKYFS